MWRKISIGVAIVIVSVLQIDSATTEDHATDASLDSYLKPYQITKLDFELLQFNIIWHDSFDGSVDYVTSHPAFYRDDKRAIYCRMRVQEKRFANDREPFSALPEWKRLAILSNVIDHFIALLKHHFPEVVLYFTFR